jgi:hypothetical protein
MSYGIIYGTTCVQTTTFTEDLTSLTQECGSVSDTYTSWTSWPAIATPANPGNGFLLLKCQSLSYAGTSTICANPALKSEISAIYSLLGDLGATVPAIISSVK